MNQPAAAAPMPRLVWLLICVGCAHSAAAIPRVAGSLWALDAGYSSTVVGAVMSVYSIGPLLLSMWAGRLADRNGFHRPAGIALAALLTDLVPLAITQNVWLIAWGIFCTGAGLIIAEIAVQRTAGRMAAAGADLKRLFGAVAFATSVSTTTSPVLAGLLIDHTGFRVTFAVLLLFPAVIWLAMRQVPRSLSRTAARAATQGRVRDLLARREVRVVLAFNIALAIAWDVHLFTVPVLGHARELSASVIGMVLGSCSVGVLGVRLLIARIGQHIDEDRGLKGALILATLVLAGYAWLPTYWGMMIGSFLVGVAIGASQPLVLASLHKVTPPDRQGQALGLRMVATLGVTTGAPLLYGALAAATVVAAPMWAAAGVIGLILALAR